MEAILVPAVFIAAITRVLIIAVIPAVLVIPVIPAITIGVGVSSPVARPRKIERVPLRAIIRILDPHDGTASTTGIANQLLPAPAIDTREAEVSRIGRHYARTLKSSPLGRASGKIPENCVLPTNFHFSRPVHDDFDRAFASVRIASTRHNGPALTHLGAHGSRRDC